MKKTKAMLLASLLLVTAILISACGSGNNNAGSSNTGNSSQPSEAGGAAGEEQVELRVMWWGDQTRADITTAMLKKFEEKHPNIKVVPEFSPFDGYFDKLNTQLASGTAPICLRWGATFWSMPRGMCCWISIRTSAMKWIRVKYRRSSLT